MDDIINRLNKLVERRNYKLAKILCKIRDESLTNGGLPAVLPGDHLMAGVEGENVFVVTDKERCKIVTIENDRCVFVGEDRKIYRLVSALVEFEPESLGHRVWLIDRTVDALDHLSDMDK
jgi:hypothetical protein